MVIMYLVQIHLVVENKPNCFISSLNYMNSYFIYGYRCNWYQKRAETYMANKIDFDVYLSF